MKALLLICLGVLALLVLSVVSFFSRPENTVSYTDKMFVISEDTSNTQVYYRLSESIQLSLYAMDVDRNTPPISVRTCGHDLALVTLSEKGYQRYSTSYKNTRRCPAGFMNRNAKVLMLIAGNRSLQNTLKNLSIRKEEKLKLRGRYMKFDRGEMQGHSFTHCMVSGDANFFIPEEVWVEGRPIYRDLSYRH